MFYPFDINGIEVLERIGLMFDESGMGEDAYTERKLVFLNEGDKKVYEVKYFWPTAIEDEKEVSDIVNAYNEIVDSVEVK